MAVSPNVFFHTPWPGLALWSVLYVSDYYLTLTCARLYRAGVNEKLVFEGSFEITPYFQSDIDSLRRISPRFVAALLASSAWLALIWKFAASAPGLYEFCLGAMISIELAVHVRHLRNLGLFRMMLASDGIRGRIEYSRPCLLHMSVVELVTFAGMFAVLFVCTQSWFVLGGAAACLATAWKHRRLARAQVASATVKAVAK